MDDREFWVRIWTILTTGVVLLGAIIATSLVLHERAYIEAGYEQTSEQGIGTLVWQKSDTKTAP